MSFTHIATKSIPIVLNLFKLFAISSLVPTPSVLLTNKGLLNFFGISFIEPKLPIFLNLFLEFPFLVNLDIYLMN